MLKLIAVLILIPMFFLVAGFKLVSGFFGLVGSLLKRLFGISRK